MARILNNSEGTYNFGLAVKSETLLPKVRKEHDSQLDLNAPEEAYYHNYGRRTEREIYVPMT